ncbi:MAG: four-carbon acid sugar kinase family protein, partial [Microbacteriaceae bacterium]
MAGHSPGFAEVVQAAPPPMVIPDARTRIREGNAAAGRRFAVLDDDPTGSQSVHGVSMVTVPEPEEYARGLAEPGSVCFILTNSRSLGEPDAVAINRAAGEALWTLQSGLGGPVAVVSRGDSTLRGHVTAEVDALDQVRQKRSGSGYDGILFAPAYFEAGRYTAGNIQWATVQGKIVPVNSTEFARDATFGYRSENLVDFLVEKSGGRIAKEQVATIGLDDIRLGGPDRVAGILGSLTGRPVVVVNATAYADLEVVVLGWQQA